ncbi:uncharacterized protein LOC123332201 isoform X2 [Bubalus bubalis]|uniref:uncharacterized protein LOC123332201 isoform X2 n=1 Tax=Bubalus bubalis TaxID=89462 RepID=UPI001D1141BF|nr:uncharacterized protein LOC123332201 isoform X2 [Bubalus bubalis]
MRKRGGTEARSHGGPRPLPGIQNTFYFHHGCPLFNYSGDFEEHSGIHFIILKVFIEETSNLSHMAQEETGYSLGDRKPLGGENIALKEAEISSPRSHLDLETNGFLCAARHSCEPSQEGAGGPIPVSPAGSVISAKLLHPSALSRANQMLWEPPWLLHHREAALELEAVLGLSAAGPFFPTVCLRFLQECHSYQHTSKDQTRVTSHPACPGVSWLHH